MASKSQHATAEQIYFELTSHVALSSDPLFNLLRTTFGEDQVRRQFDIGSRKNDAFDKGQLYSPRLDYAVGPYNLDRNKEENVGRINSAFRDFQPMIQQLVEEGNGNFAAISHYNSNPRMFIAIEMEDKTSRKHRLGGIINASALGKVGILVGANAEVYWSVFKIMSYLEYLRTYKSVILAPNVIAINRSRFVRVLRKFPWPAKTR